MKFYKLNTKLHFCVLTIHILEWAQYIMIFIQECHNQYRWLSLQWRHNRYDSVSNHQPHYCFLNRLFRHRSKKTSKPRVTDLCAGNSPEAGEFPAQRASNAENVSIWWRHHGPFDHTPEKTYSAKLLCLPSFCCLKLIPMANITPVKLHPMIKSPAFIPEQSNIPFVHYEMARPHQMNSPRFFACYDTANIV